MKKILSLGIIFFVLGLFVNFSFTKPIDAEITRILQSITPYSFDPFLSWFSLFGSFFVIVGFTVLFLLIFKKFRLVIVYLIAIFLTHIIEIFGKNFIIQPIPPREIVRTKLLFYISHPDIPLKFAFPSGHSLRTVLSGVIFFYLVSKSKLKAWQKLILKIFIIISVFIMLYSRISLGEHWFSDVLGGAILGYLAGLLTLKFSASEKNV